MFSCSSLDRNEGMDQTEGLNDAPGPLVYADTDVPQIPNADHSSITLSRDTVYSLGFLSSSFFPLSTFQNLPIFHTDKAKNTRLTDTHTSTRYDQLSHPRRLQF